MNALRGEGVTLSRILRVAPDELRLSMPARDFRRIRRHAGKLHCRIHIEGRGGAPFLLMRLYRRPALWLGCLIGFALLIAASTRLWFVRIEGNARVSEATIRRALDAQGLKPGAPRPDGDFDAAADAIATYDERIAWIGLDLDGVCLTVHVMEAAYDMLALDPTVPCDVVAVKDGVVTSIRALEGAAMRAVGEYAYAGDVLISGIVELTDIPEPLLVHARGLVKANVYYFSEYAQPLATLDRGETGASAAYRRVTLCGYTLYESEPPFADYEIAACEERPAHLPLLPVSVFAGEYREMAPVQRELTPAEAAETALVEAEKGALLRIPVDAAIVEKTSEWQERDGLIVATCGIVTEESIGLTKEIGY